MNKSREETWKSHLKHLENEPRGRELVETIDRIERDDADERRADNQDRRANKERRNDHVYRNDRRFGERREG